MLKYPDGTKLQYIGTDRTHFVNGEIYVVFRDGSSYEIPQIRQLQSGWNSYFIEDLNQFRLLSLIDWQERIERLSKLEGTK